MHLWDTLRRGAGLVVLLALLSAGLLPGVERAAAQDGGDRAAEIEALAYAVHLQNSRLDNYTVWIGGQMGSAEMAPRFVTVGDRLESWTLDGFAGDAEYALAGRERPVLLNFWASWCPPCRVEFPHLARVAAAPDAHGFDVVFVNVVDDEAEALDYLAAYPDTLRTVIDTGERLAQRLGVVSLPTNVLIDIDGTVLLIHLGTVTPTVTALLEQVAAHPGVGGFLAADYPERTPGAILAPVHVADALPLTPGETVTGWLDDERFQQVYTFSGQAGEVYTAFMNASTDEDTDRRDDALDPYLVILAVDGERLDENDDIKPGVITDARLSVKLPEDGVYLVVATRFLEAEGFGSGEYTLKLILAARM